MPGLDSITRRAEADGLALEDDGAAVGRELARQHAHQGGLAGAVLAKQRMNLAGAEIEIHALQRREPAEALVDSGHADEVGHGMHCNDPSPV